jgi:hypothetical protein
MTDPDTLNGDPNGLKREQIGTALQQALPSLAPCLQGAPGASVGLSFDADPQGRARNIKVSGASPDAERCVSTALAQVKLPEFAGKAVPINFPLTVYRPAAAPGAAPPPPSAPPSPPAPSPGSGYPPPSALPVSPPSKPTPSGGGPFIQP